MHARRVSGCPLIPNCWSAAEPVVEDTSLLRGWTSWETIKSIGPNGGKQIEFVLVDRTNLQRRVVAVHASEVKPDDRCDTTS